MKKKQAPEPIKFFAGLSPESQKNLMQLIDKAEPVIKEFKALFRQGQVLNVQYAERHKDFTAFTKSMKIAGLVTLAILMLLCIMLVSTISYQVHISKQVTAINQTLAE